MWLFADKHPVWMFLFIFMPCLAALGISENIMNMVISKKEK